jgi:hypothetical protein
MRLQHNGRAARAVAALVAAVIAGAVIGGVASASTAPAAHPVRLCPATGCVAAPAAQAATAAHTVRSAHAVVTAQIAVSAHAAVARIAMAPRSARRRRSGHRVAAHRAARPRLRAQLLHSDLLIGQPVALVGATRPGAADRLIGVQQQLGSRWIVVARARTGADGRFFARFRAQTLGRLRLRVRLAQHGGWGATAAAPIVTVFHQALVSWYGPGGMTACGETLGVDTQGVANLTLPCGTMVTLRYRDRTVRVPVIDRGPFVAGREYDLTYATRLALGAGDLTVIWASA